LQTSAEATIPGDANTALKAGLRWLLPRGRTGRSHFAVSIAFVLALGYLLVSGIDATLGEGAGTAVVALLVWVAICIASRRLHDTGRAAWWLAAFLVPVLGALWLAWVLFLQKGTEGSNQFGPDPRQRAADYLTVA
jgi:uncharacterized membrane protein YhaH (DUF805 family)